MDELARPVTVHMIGNAHIDPVWLWTLPEGRAEVLASYRTAIGLIEDSPGYVFTSGGAVTYRWAAEDDPALFAAIRAAVAHGQWVPVNGWWIQPDCNVPSGESFARHALYGQRELQALLGRRARVGYNVDSFGHAGTLPQLLRLGGLDRYVFFRPGRHEKDLPAGPFWWEAPGGARVLACRPPLHYNSPEDADIAARIAAAAAEAPAGLPQVMCFYGVGNHGGGPTRRNVAAVAATQAEEHGWRAEFSSPEDYFAAVDVAGTDWPVVRDDLQHHARGCYTALSRVKWENRRAEHALGAAERWASLAALLAGGADPRATLQAAWEKVLFNQFHDILAGTSIRAAYEEVWRTYDEACLAADVVQSAAMGALGAGLAVAERDHPVAVWNPLPWERREVVHLAVPLGGWEHDFTGGRFPGTPRVTDADGQPVDSQLLDVEMENNTYVAHIAARVEAPALGARVLYVALPETEPPTAAPVAPTTETMENDRLRLQFNPRTGWLSSLLGLEDGAEYLGGPAGILQVLDDPTDTWSHGLAAYSEVIGAFTASEPPRLIHDGPVQRTVEVRSAWGRSTAVQRYTLAAGSAVVDLEIEVDWREQLKMLKLALPLNLAAPQATASAPYGWVVRPPTGEEEPCQGWVDVSGAGEGGPRGLALLNDGQYGYDLTAAVLRLSLLRSPIYAFHEPRRAVPGVTYHYTDQGPHRFHCRLLPHAGGWDAACPVQASLALQEPLLARPMAPQAGEAPGFSLLRLDCPTAVLTTVKLAEDGGALIVRGHEAAGRAARLTIVSERLGRTWAYTAAPHEIWTLRLPLAAGPAVALDLLEEPLA